MKILITALLLSLFIPEIYGQKENPEIDKMYFLVGTLGDYMGRQKYPEVENRVDMYYKGADKLINYIISNFRDPYPDLRLDSINFGGIEMRYFLFSTSLAKKIEEYYTYKNSRTGIRKPNTPELDKLRIDSIMKTKDFFSKYFDSVYTGSINKDIFKSNVQKLSFLAGAYTRFHDSKGQKYCIKIFNSASKARVCSELLKEINCTDVSYEILPNIPACHLVYFTPTEELIRYMDEYACLR